MTVGALAMPMLASAQPGYAVLHSFTHSISGRAPLGTLTQAADGNFYGTTECGGAFDKGTVFRMNAAGSVTVLYPFSGGSADGAFPFAGLIQASDGNFYGTTYQGGPADKGAVFKMTPAGAVTVLHFFTGTTDGSYPVATLVEATDGNFYGTAGLKVFRVTPGGTFTVLATLAAAAFTETSQLVQASDGNLYGTASHGGASNAGSIFRMALDGTGSVLYSFAGSASSSARPVSLVQASDGNFYGTTNAGGSTKLGTVFQMTSTGTVTVLYTFTGGTGDGAQPGGLIVGADGNFYGLTDFGGVGSGRGTVFRMAQAGTVTTLYSFTSLDAEAGHAVTPSLMQAADGDFCLTTYSGGVNGAGSVLRMSLDGGTVTSLHTFTYGADGANPNRLVQASDGNLYGTTKYGGPSNDGTVFRVSPAAAVTIQHAFSRGTEGRYPHFLIQGSNGNLYGTTESTVFTMTPAGTLAVLHDFPPPEYDYPNSLVQATDGSFYGTTEFGGLDRAGAVFRMTPEGTVTTLHSFPHVPDEPALWSVQPYGLIKATDGNVYGMTLYDGGYVAGTIFQMTPAGAASVLHEFTRAAGYGSLLQATDGNFYGTSANGFFRITPAGAFTLLHAFASGTEGSGPRVFFQAADGTFYGTAGSGGASGGGTVFTITAEGTVTVLHTFTGGSTDGSGPTALVQGADGRFYGTTTSGGAGGIGVVFRFEPAPSAPAITTQPANQTVVAGGTATFTAAASGTPAPTVQWQVSTNGGSTFGDISGATSTTYSFTTIAADTGKQFRAVFTNGIGSPATSDTAILTVNFAPTVTTQPANQTVIAGGTATFMAAASGNPAPAVQWQVSTNGGSTFGDISGATSTTYSFTTVAADTGKQFRAVFTNSVGSATSTAATLTVNVAPTVTTQPANQTVLAGGAATFTAAASGSPTPAVQWQMSTNGGKTFSDISGATSPTYALTAAAADSGRQFRAVFTNSVGSATSDAATLTVHVGLAITMQPVNLTVMAGDTATFTAAAIASLTPTVQWQQMQTSTTERSTFSDISGATSPTYAFTAAVADSGTQFRAVFTDGVTAATSEAARLTVFEPSATAPFGQVDTLAQDATGVVGAIGVTGWALDDVGVSTVTIYRNCLSFDDPASCQTILGHRVVFIGDAAWLAGARPDVEAAFPTHPAAYRAGWGYLLVTSLLPHVPHEQGSGGQGALILYAFATDSEGQIALLGRSSDPASPAFQTPTSITLANDTIATPFGAIETPAPGATVSGTVTTVGWALTPDTDRRGILIPPNGSTMAVFIDGLPVAQVAYNQCRGTVGTPVPATAYCDDDVASLFGNPTPQSTLTTRTSNPTPYRNLDAGRGAIGAYQIDTTTMSNGLHTMAWSVTDSAGRTEGIGSRLFTVLNGGSGVVTPAAELADAPALVVGDAASLDALTPDREGVRVRGGFDLGARWTHLAAQADGSYAIEMKELGRVEVWLGPVDAGYLSALDSLRDLPPGSSLDPATGHFAWVPPAGYVGSYTLVFTHGTERITVAVSIGPAAAARRERKEKGVSFSRSDGSPRESSVPEDREYNQRRGICPHLCGVPRRLVCAAGVGAAQDGRAHLSGPAPAPVGAGRRSQQQREALLNHRGRSRGFVMPQDPAYGHTVHLPGVPFDTARQRITDALKQEGFGVLTEIDVKATMKSKLDVDFRRYVILGACNPTLAHKALTADLAIGLLLPCNVCVWEEEGGSVVSLIRPEAMFSVVKTPGLEPVVAEADQRLRNALNALRATRPA